MRFKHFYAGYILILLALFFAISFVVLKSKGKEFIISPLPQFLTVFTNEQVRTLDLWTPIFEMFTDNLEKTQNLNINARSALVYDLTTNKTIFSKDANKKLPMASLTKIMTAIIALESGKTGERLKVLEEDLVGENSMGLTLGEALIFEELLYGLILPSGNDAAEVLARNILGSREKFVASMNKRAKALGALNTNFTNPTGLEGDGNQYTTAYDLLVITKYALNFPLFRKVVKTFEYHIPYSELHKEYYLYNDTNLLTSYPGVLGVKTGFTSEAGLCLVTYLEYKGHKIIGILLGSENRRQEMKDLLDYSLKIQGITPPPHS